LQFGGNRGRPAAQVGSGAALLGQRPLSPLVCVLETVTPSCESGFMSPLLAIFGTIGTTELIVIMVVILVLFGHRLPSVMRSMGRGIKEFKDGINDTTADPEALEKDVKSDKQDVYEK
jgi:sec-independent protein translocase protein TatA